MNRFVLIMITHPVVTDTQQNAIQALLNSAPDWLRFANGHWIVWTSKTPREWYDILRPVLGEKEHYILLSYFNPLESQGMQSKKMWEWVYKTRPGKPGPSSN